MEPYIGEIQPITINFAPRGWALCDGSLLSIHENVALYSLLGTSFGGDGVKTFALPDLRSRIPLGQSEHHAVGQKGGSESVELALTELPMHGHIPACSTAEKSDSKDATNAFWSASGARGRQYATAPGSSQMNYGSLRPEGASQQHENRMPVLAINYIIAVAGVFPALE